MEKTVMDKEKKMTLQKSKKQNISSIQVSDRQVCFRNKKLRKGGGRMEKMAYKIKELTNIIGLSKAHIYRLIKEGKFPKPVKIGKSSLWLRKDIENWLESLRQNQDETSESM